jgi:hypothetical protein
MYAAAVGRWTRKRPVRLGANRRGVRRSGLLLEGLQRERREVRNAEGIGKSVR